LFYDQLLVRNENGSLRLGTNKEGAFCALAAYTRNMAHAETSKSFGGMDQVFDMIIKRSTKTMHVTLQHLLID
jgi:hypothetical protein